MHSGWPGGKPAGDWREGGGSSQGISSLGSLPRGSPRIFYTPAGRQASFKPVLSTCLSWILVTTSSPHPFRPGHGNSYGNLAVPNQGDVPPTRNICNIWRHFRLSRLGGVPLASSGQMPGRLLNILPRTGQLSTTEFPEMATVPEVEKPQVNAVITLEYCTVLCSSLVPCPCLGKQSLY